jgi:hypothetical protein
VESKGDQSGLKKQNVKSVTSEVNLNFYLAEMISATFSFSSSDPTLARVAPNVIQNCSAS